MSLRDGVSTVQGMKVGSRGFMGAIRPDVKGSVQAS